MSPTPVSLLIVDDDPVFALFVQQMVLSLRTEFACAPQWVDSAERAIEELKHADYKLVLLDYHLPGADGLEVLAQIRNLPDPQPAVIMLTGSGSETVAVEAMKRGARDYLTKGDLDVAPLLRALRSAWTQKQLADQIARYNAQMRSDLEMARHLQHSLLPDSYPCFPPSASPDESALRFVHRFIPASDLAGDFFSVLRLSDSQAGVFLCDVMGHGVRSALVTAMVRTLVDNLATRATNPGQFLGKMNRRLAGLLKPNQGPMFATAFYLVLDIARGRMSYATAGHPPPLHLQRQAGLVSSLPLPPQPGPALGLFAETHYATAEAPLAAGDLLLLFTDGLFEVTSPDGQEDYGRERLLAAAHKHINLSPSELCDALIADVKDFAQGAPMSDDLCLLSVEVAHLQSNSTP